MLDRVFYYCLIFSSSHPVILVCSADFHWVAKGVQYAQHFLLYKNSRLLLDTDKYIVSII